MKILQISTYSSRGGGPQAAYRLNNGLRRLGYESLLFVAQGEQNDPSITVFSPPMDIISRIRRRIKQMAIDWRTKKYPNPQKFGYEKFSTDQAVYGRSLLDQLPQVDIINLHWITNFVDYRYLFPIVSRQVPLVWTLHDMNAFTGGCHYDDLCGRFVERCGRCPQLHSEWDCDLSYQVWNNKNRIYSKLKFDDLHLVTPSQWMSNQIQKSSLLNRFSVTVIPNGIDINDFAPRNRSFARSVLGVPEDAKVILFAVNNNVNRKGFLYLKQALQDIDNIERFFLLSVGNDIPEIRSTIQHMHLGFTGNPRLLSLAYSAADVFVIPSLQDNFPNTILESFSCGTPVVGFDIGGISELIHPGINGLLVPIKDIASLRQAILEILDDPIKRRKMSKNCRMIAVNDYSLEVQSERYVDLYKKILNHQII